MTLTLGYDGLAERVLACPPRLGPVRLVCIDGPSGSGKTTLARRLHAALARAGQPGTLLHLEDVYEGWSGLPSVAPRLERDLLVPLRAGRPGRTRTWDWADGTWGGHLDVPPGPVLLLEGCGAADEVLAKWAVLLVWVEAERGLRRRRGLARDGEHLEAELETWGRVEDAHFAEQRTRARCDLLVDGAPRAAHDPDSQLVLLDG